MNDQAARLREMIQQKKRLDKIKNDKDKYQEQMQPRVICITSGKGGVGKTNFTLNLAIALSQQNKRVVIIDADLGLANIDVVMGVLPKYSLLDVINGNKTLKEVVIQGPNGIKIVSGGSGILDLIDMSGEKLKDLIEKFNELNQMADIILIDTGAGLSKSVLSFVLAAQEVIVVCTPEPTAVTDAYAMIKTIGLKDSNKCLSLLVNRVESIKEGKMTFEKLQNVSSRFLNIKLEKLGYLSEDIHVSRSVKLQKPFLLQYPRSVVSKNIEIIAQRLLDKDVPVDSSGDAKGFFNRVISLFR
ncbi:MinD/ParA family protein [Alkaliphilus crotonatoxidans]